MAASRPCSCHCFHPFSISPLLPLDRSLLLQVFFAVRLRQIRASRGDGGVACQAPFSIAYFRSFAAAAADAAATGGGNQAGGSHKLMPRRQSLLQRYEALEAERAADKARAAVTWGGERESNKGVGEFEAGPASAHESDNRRHLEDIWTGLRITKRSGGGGGHNAGTRPLLQRHHRHQQQQQYNPNLEMGSLRLNDAMVTWLLRRVVAQLHPPPGSQVSLDLSNNYLTLPPHDPASDILLALLRVRYPLPSLGGEANATSSRASIVAKEEAMMAGATVCIHTLNLEGNLLDSASVENLASVLVVSSPHGDQRAIQPRRRHHFTASPSSPPPLLHSHLRLQPSPGALCTHLRVLNLAHNKIGDDGAAALGMLITRSTTHISELNISWNDQVTFNVRMCAENGLWLRVVLCGK